MSKLTPWYPPEIKPVRTGCYQATSGSGFDGSAYFFWAGDNWHFSFYPVAGDTGHLCTNQNKCWRGLASKPK